MAPTREPDVSRKDQGRSPLVSFSVPMSGAGNVHTLQRKTLCPHHPWSPAVAITLSRRAIGEPGVRPTARALALLTVMVLLTLGMTVAAPVPAARAATGDVGVEGLSHSGTGTPTGTKRAESVLWWNDGSWWGNLWDTVSGDFHIFRLDTTTQKWVDTGVTTETRANSHSDVLWDGTTLYVASHLFVNDGLPSQPNFPTRLFRYTYDSSTKKYVSAGNPTQINNRKTETLVIDKDSTGRLWATWQQDNRIYVNRTGTDGQTWGTPFSLASAPAVSVDDNSALIAYGPAGARKMGVMWSSQGGAAADGMYFSWHQDGAADSTWSAAQAATQGAGSGDDHMNLKWLDSTASGVYAAIKTSYTSSSQPLIQLLVLNVSTNTWSQHTIATVAECPNRVILLIDESKGLLRTFATYPKPTGVAGVTNASVCTSSGGAVYEKSAPLGNVSFGTAKALRIMDADQYLHNATSTKQNIKAGMGVAVLADVNSTSRYWHFYEAPGGAPPQDTTAPDTTITSGPPSTTSATTASFAFSSNESGSTYQCSLDTAAFASCASPTSYSGLATGSHTFRVRATDPAGNTDQSAATQTWTVGSTTPPPTGSIIRESVTTTVNTTASTTVSVTKPAGTVAGNVLVSCLALNGGSVAGTGVPAGWTPLASVTAQANPKVFGYYKVATASEPASYTWMLASSVAGGGGVARYSGASGVDGAATSASGASAASGTVPGVTTTTGNTMLVGCMGVNSSSATLTSPAGLSQAWEVGDRRFELADGRQTTAGGSGSKTWTFSASREWAGWLVALRAQP
jgi:hypothetical protein